MRIVCALSVFVICMSLGAAETPFVVHEWGVMVRGRTTHGSLLCAPDELITGLPAFALLLKNEYTPKTENHGWDKPVLHFYGPENLAITVKVLTPQGRPTAYYPKPNLVEKTVHITDVKAMDAYSLTDCVGLEWSGTLSAQPSKKIPQPAAGHWWNDARQIPSMYVNTPNGAERFLFYEATAFQEPAITSSVSGTEIVLKNSHSAASGPVLLILNDGTTRYLTVVKAVPAGGSVTVSKADLLRTPVDAAAILDAARAQWESFGMTHDEAAAIVSVWKSDLLNTVGFLCIARMPEELYEKMFPLTITPKPASQVRAGVIFDTLSGEEARLDWLPQIKVKLEPMIRNLSDDDFEVRQQAVSQLIRMGDIILPRINELTKSENSELGSNAREIQKRLQPLIVDTPLEKGGAENSYIRRR